ncbi:hypothetical protein [Streptomyces sp. NPDC015414]|uniref:hypothetical protein n=1 Tax=Streptomyces sp. NPDC015414 TaxID=3364957 RepID=UPI003700C1CB
MSTEALAALAAAGGTAVVQAAGTDVWATVRQSVARLLGRGDAQQEAAELSRLDQMHAVLAAEGDRVGHRARWEAVWQTRLEVVLEALDAQERATVAAQLAEVISQAQSARGGVHAAPGGVAAGGDVRIAAEGGSVAGAVVRVEGGVQMTAPFSPPQRPQS